MLCCRVSSPVSKLARAPQEANSIPDGGTKPYADMRHDRHMADLYRANAQALGRRFPDMPELITRAAASTDMGNVSHVVPSIHPFIGIDSWPAANHQPEFTGHASGPAADRAILDAAVGMAWTAIDLAIETGSA